jgi:hypothetical protein
VEFNRLYKAPSIPKLNRRTISSPFGEKSLLSSKLKLSKKIFSFIKKPSLVDSKILELKESKDLEERNKGREILVRSLVETNKVLLEIQKQLALDFSLRIAEEKESIKKIKATRSKKRFDAKENIIEASKKIGSGILNQVEKILSPVKGIFQKIIEFFSIILTGILVNTAFKWLQDPQNRKKVTDFFEFLTKNWKIIAGVIGTLVIVSWIRKIYRAGKLIYDIIRNIRRILPFGKSPPKPSPGGGSVTPKIGYSQTNAGRAYAGMQAQRNLPQWAQKASGGSASRFSASNLRIAQGAGNVGDRLRVATGGRFGVGNIAERLASKTGKTAAPPAARGAAALGGGKLAGKIIPGLATIIGVIEGINRLKKGDVVGAMLSFGTAIPGFGWGFLAADVIRALVGSKQFDNALGGVFGGGIGLSDEKKRERMSSKSATERVLTEMSGPSLIGGWSAGGTVGGKGSGNVDSVRAMLAPGEEVIRTSSAMLFRPLLKDINENAGRLWEQFRQAVTQLFETNSRQKQSNEEFKKVVEEFNTYLKQEIQKSKISSLGKGGGIGGGIGQMFGKAGQISEEDKEKGQTSIAFDPTNRETGNIKGTDIGMDKGGEKQSSLNNIRKSPILTTTPERNQYPAQININPNKIPDIKLISPVNNSREIPTLSKAVGKPAIIPMNLPPIKAQMPKLPITQSVATEVPNISSVNMLNPYMQLTPNIYGIYV